MHDEQHSDIAIIGAGFSGLGTAIRLKQEGIEDFVVLERGDDVGGTWHYNTYPGCGCDVPSHLYSFSFAPNPTWTRTYSRQPEIRDYLRRCADDFGVRPHVRLACEVSSASWDERSGRWRIETSSGPVTARVLVAGTGPLTEPKTPDLPGIATFARRSTRAPPSRASRSRGPCRPRASATRPAPSPGRRSARRYATSPQPVGEP
ncbi:MAG: NAD(P)/FAD-dependent oxidoreductase [Thermoleophilaceae bacterium]